MDGLGAVHVLPPFLEVRGRLAALLALVMALWLRSFEVSLPGGVRLPMRGGLRPWLVGRLVLGRPALRGPILRQALVKTGDAAAVAAQNGAELRLRLLLPVRHIVL